MDDTELLSEELKGFGLRVSDESTLRKLLQLGIRWNCDEISLVEKYVAFQRNFDLPDLISEKDVDFFDRETSSRLESSRHKTVKPNPAPLTPQLLPQKMLEELMATESQNEQYNLFSSYLPNANVPKLSARPRPINLADKENIDHSSASSVTSKDEIICAFHAAHSFSLPTARTRVASSLWSITEVKPFDGAVRYMHQPVIENAEILDNWAWKIVKKILASVPEDVLSETRDHSVGCLSQRNDNSATIPATSHEKLSSSQPSFVNGDGLDRTTYLRPTNARLQSTAIVAGRVSSNVTVSASTRQSEIYPNGPLPGPLFSKARLQLASASLISLRRVGGCGTESSGATRMEFLRSDTRCAYSIYAGQPVVLRAANPTGHQLLVSETLPTPVTPPPRFEAPNSTLYVMVASGPYTLSDSNEPSLLLALLRSVRKHQPHILVLTGPFVDCEHPAVHTHHEHTFEELFQSRLNTVAEYCSHLDVQVVVVSSWREMHHDPVYPTPPLNVDWVQETPELASWYKNIHFVWDPCLLRFGDYIFGITSVDVLFQLSSEEINAGCSDDRIARLCRHIFASESFYPVHPPADDLPLDYPLWDRRSHLHVTPHCLIVPSRLRQFVKDVEGVLCVNPGHVSRGQSSGSYACITIAPNKPFGTDEVEASVHEATHKAPGCSIIAQSTATVFRI
ncbi:unnamed protein product [Dicrocoelium dendriticum]|nr:unnamed protein product [Dicrocoelium dendriticum]